MDEGNGLSQACWGCDRRDCEPHRGRFLQFLALVGMLLGVLSFCLGFPALAGFPLGVAVCAMARRDRDMMDRGLMDPDGKQTVEVVRKWAINAVILCTLATCVWAVLLLLALPFAHF
jgi:hypothetical protein